MEPRLRARAEAGSEKPGTVSTPAFRTTLWRSGRGAAERSREPSLNPDCDGGGENMEKSLNFYQCLFPCFETGIRMSLSRPLWGQGNVCEALHKESFVQQRQAVQGNLLTRI